MGRVVGLAALLLFIDAERAEACSCGERDPALSPRAGATGVALNPAIAIRGSMYDDLTLRTATGDIAIEREQLTNGIAVIRPQATLSPNTTYEVVLDQSTFTFTTGDQRDDTPPAAASLRAITPEVMKYPVSCISSCILSASYTAGHTSRMDVDYDLPSDAAFAVLELRDVAKPDVIIRQRAASYLGNQYCDDVTSPVLDPEATYCARLVTYDVAGNVSTSEEVCSPVARCEPVDDPRDCSPVKVCDPVSNSGCATSNRPGGLVLALALLLLIRRKRS